MLSALATVFKYDTSQQIKNILLVMSGRLLSSFFNLKKFPLKFHFQRYLLLFIKNQKLKETNKTCEVTVKKFISQSEFLFLF